MVRISVFVIISIFVTILYFVGLLKFLTDVGEDKCEMTYMYEYPQFIRVSNNIDKKYPKYGLYAYGEGRLTSRVRNMYFDGIPVLFIPGNAGSYKQVRSLSSVALRKALQRNTQLHFDYFTLDLNDEFSGLYGPLLYDQYQYVNQSFYRIFDLYKDKNKPPSIVLIGHSMGGVIAKILLSQIPEPNLVPILITLASPSKRAPLILDYHLERFYKIPGTDTPTTTTVINLSGGYRDFLIPTFLSKVKNESNLNVVTSNIPLTWIENNHVQILWCKQLILALNRALFDSVDPETNFISSNSTFRHIVFNHHLSKHSGIKIKNLPQYLNPIKLDFKGKWIESLFTQYTVDHLKGVKEPHWYMVKLTPLPGHDILNVLALNLEITNWVYVCNANYLKGPSRVCPEAHQLTHFSEIAPSIKYKRRLIQINLKEVYRNNTELTHVVFRTLSTDEPIVFHVDVHSQTERIITVDLPKWWATKTQIVVEKTPEKAVNLKLLLPGLQNLMQVYELFIVPQHCTQDNHHASASLVSPWADEDSHHFTTNTENKPFQVRLYTSKPGNIQEDPYIKFILDPSCLYQISIRPSLIGSLGQLARFYTPLLLTNIAVVLLLALKYQMYMMKQGYWPIIFTALTQGPRGYYVLTLTRIFSHTIKSWPTNFLPKPDIWYIIDDGLDFMIMPFVLYICGVGIVWFLSILFAISLFTLESATNKVALKFLTRTFIWSNYFMTFLHKVPAVVAAILIFISMTTCGGLALCLGTVFYFLRLTHMSQDYIEDVGWYLIKRFGWKFLNKFFRKSARITTITNVNEESTNTEQKNLEIKKTKKVEQIVDKDSTNELQEIKPTESQICNTNEQNETIEHKTVNITNNKIEHISQNDCNVSQGSETNSDVPERTTENISTASGISESYLQYDENTKLSSDYNSIFFHSTIFFLWCIVTLLNIPAVLTWAHNFKFHKFLSPDDSFWPGLALSLCAFPLWQFEFPRQKKRGLEIMEFVITIVILLSLTFATVSLYRLNFLLTFVIVIITLHQLFAPQEVVVEEINDGKNDVDKIKEKYDDIKKKID